MRERERERDGRKQLFFPAVCAFLFCIIIFTHCFQLGTVQRGLNFDEVGMSYDAWSISKTGHDSYLNSWPVYFINRGDGMSALYVYLEAIVMSVFGVSVAGMRAPAVLASFITLFAGAYIIRSQWPKRRLPLLLFLLLFAVAPYFTIYSRIALDCLLFLPLSTLLLASIIFNLRRKKPHWWLSSVVAGITLYTYVLSWIIVPLFLIMFTAYLIRCHRLSGRQAVTLWAPFCVIALPLVGVAAVNFLGVPQFNIGPLTVPKLPLVRKGDLGFSRYALFGIYYLLEILFSGDTRFVYTNSQFAPFYLISIPAIFIGLYTMGRRSIKAIRNRLCNPSFVLIAWGMAYLIQILLRQVRTEVHNLNGLFFIMLFAVVFGWVVIYDTLKVRLTLTKPEARPKLALLALAFVLVYGIAFGVFINEYFIRRPQSWDTGALWRNESLQFGLLQADFPSIEKVADYINALPDSCKTKEIQVTRNTFSNVYLWLAAEVSPYQIAAERRSGDTTQTLGRYHFRNPDDFQTASDISLDEIYVVGNWKTSELKLFQSINFNTAKRLGKYWVFANQ